MALKPKAEEAAEPVIEGDATEVDQPALLAA